MGLPTLTRGIGARDDYLDLQSAIYSSSGSVTVTTNTSDGDIYTLIGFFTNPSAGDAEIDYLSVNLNSTTYPNMIARFKIVTLDANLVVRPYIRYSDASLTIGPILASAPTTGFIAPVTPVTTGKTINRIGIMIRSETAQTGTFNFSIQKDFIMSFKELLTLPTAMRPLTEQDVSIMPVIPVLGRQGGLVQYIGAMSPRYTIAGGLVNTTSGQSGWTQTYTADQWWQLLKGIWIEQNTLQADGNPTWQYLTSDNITGKVLLSYGPQQVPGRVAYHEYVLTLVEFDINGLSTANLPGITY